MQGRGGVSVRVPGGGGVYPENLIVKFKMG